MLYKQVVFPEHDHNLLTIVVTNVYGTSQSFGRNKYVGEEKWSELIK